MFADNLVTFENFLSFTMKQETSEPEYPMIGNDSEISLKTALKTLCEPLPIFYIDNNYPVHSAGLCLMRSHILYCNYLLLMLGLEWLLSQISSNTSVRIGSASDSSPD